MKEYFKYLVVLAALTSAFLGRAEPAKKNDILYVELEIFSGRPNPTFAITDPKEIREVLEMAKELPTNFAVSSAEPAPAPVLGYRGITVKNGSSLSPELESMSIRHADVQLRHNGTKASPGMMTSKVSTPVRQVSVDSGAKLEQRLLELGRKQGAIDDHIIEHIKKQK